MSTEKIKLLMVDDEPDFLKSTATALSRRGFEVSTASDGSQAQSLLEQRDYDIALLDVKMPGIDGVELFHWIKRKKPDMPVLLLTGHGSVQQAFQTSRSGVADYLTKPCEVEVIAEKLRAAIQHQTAAKVKLKSPSGTVSALLIDDEEQLLSSLKNVLERRGMTVSTALDGQSGLKQLNETLVDVVVLDVKMPGMDGIEVLKHIRKTHPLVEVILLTGHPSVGAAMEGMKLGAFDYIIKPPDVEALAQVIHKANQKRLGDIADRQREIKENILADHPD